jgi:hypothetical protein
MIQAKARMADGRVMILLGLSQGNIDRLKQQQPIHVDPQVLLSVQPGDVIGAITIIYGKTEADMAKMLKDGGMIGTDTIVHAVPKGSRNPT